jgi:hypothetical protein
VTLHCAYQIHIPFGKEKENIMKIEGCEGKEQFESLEGREDGGSSRPVFDIQLSSEELIKATFQALDALDDQRFVHEVNRVGVEIDMLIGQGFLDEPLEEVIDAEVLRLVSKYIDEGNDLRVKLLDAAFPNDPV